MCISAFRVACVIPFCLPNVFPLISSAMFIAVWANRFNVNYDHYSIFYAALVIELFVFASMLLSCCGLAKATTGTVVLLLIAWIFSTAVGFYGLPYLRSDCRAELLSYCPNCPEPPSVIGFGSGDTPIVLQ